MAVGLFIRFIVVGQHLKHDSLINYSFILNGKDDTQFLTSGTGSIIHFKTKYYLVTNFHVFSGKDALTNQKFPDQKDTNTAISVIFQPKDRKSKFVPIVYPIYSPNGTELFKKFIFQNTIIDIAVMPIVLPFNIAKFSFELTDLDTSFSYTDARKLMMFGFPYGKFKNIWQPTELDGNAVTNSQSGPFIYDPFVFIDTAPIPGMSGSPIYEYDSENKIKVLSVASNMTDFMPSMPRMKGRSIYIKYAMQLIREMYLAKAPSVKGEVYQAK